VSQPGVEKIGLARSSEEQVAEPEVPKAAQTVEPPSRQSRRIHPLLVLGLLVAIAGLLLALSNQAQRATHLESQVEFLSSELEQASADLAGYEQQMDGVRNAVADLNHQMSSLSALVNQPPDPGAGL